MAFIVPFRHSRRLSSLCFGGTKQERLKGHVQTGWTGIRRAGVGTRAVKPRYLLGEESNPRRTLISFASVFYSFFHKMINDAKIKAHLFPSGVLGLKVCQPLSPPRALLGPLEHRKGFVIGISLPTWALKTTSLWQCRRHGYRALHCGFHTSPQNPQGGKKQIKLKAGPHASKLV